MTKTSNIFLLASSIRLGDVLIKITWREDYLPIFDKNNFCFSQKVIIGNLSFSRCIRVSRTMYKYLLIIIAWIRIEKRKKNVIFLSL